MSFYFKVKGGVVVDSEFSEIDLYSDKAYSFYSVGLSQTDINRLSEAHSQGGIADLLDSDACTFGNFLLIVVEKESKTFVVYNDHFGSNEIYYAQDDDFFYISSSIKKIFSESIHKPVININAVYEHVVFQNVLPPETIYKDISILQLASMLVVSDQALVSIYWNLDTLLGEKELDYSTIVLETRRKILKAVRKTPTEKVSVALSGGIDSGGLLGMTCSENDDPVPSLSVGGHGPSSGDLVSARVSAAFNHSTITEMYPSKEDFIDLAHVYSFLEQPVLADLTIVHTLINKKAEELDIDAVIYGFGAEMHLGNLKISQLAYWMDPLEKYLPILFVKVLYSLVASVKKMSVTQRAFLFSLSWVDRFMYARGALFLHEKNYFTHDSKEVWQHVKNKVENSFPVSSTNRIDYLVKRYFFSWVNYQQWRELIVISRPYSVRPILPFNTTQVASLFFSVPNKFRKKNKWQKAVIRDSMRPYIPDDLYVNPRRSILIPYSKILNGLEGKIIKYLRESEAVGELFDYTKLEKNYKSMPDSSLFLVRILGVAIWYDSQWHPERVKEFNKIFGG
jgi:asparagine synthetase B (glutamine-hydrolysing)